ncbi:MAG: hypothetical protein Q9216_006562 [Gyalolechia sp. 2 TL-2023]
MDSEDGQTFVKDLAHFVRSHEKALANALQLHRPKDKAGPGVSQTVQTSSNALLTATPANNASAISSALTSILSLGSFSFKPHSVKPAKLTLTAHHLFYLLSRFEEIGITVGPLNVRTENLHAEASPANYVSFLRHSQRSHGRNDRESIHSVTSVRSLITGLSAIWSGFGSSNSNVKGEKSQAQSILDLKYLYSAFTKIPCLRLMPDRKTRLIQGFEEFPFDTAVPLHAFKNLSALEICDVDFRQFFGWDKLAEQLRSLTLKRASMDDPNDLLTGIVLDDMDKRRRRSSKAQSSPVLTWPPSPSMRLTDVAKAHSSPTSSAVDVHSGLNASPQNECMPAAQKPDSLPNRPISSKQSGSSRHPRCNSMKIKRSGSESSDSSVQSNLLAIGAHQSGNSPNILLPGILPSSKWRFLRHLSLADNGLTYLPANGLVPLADNLQSLDLSSNLFTEVPDGLTSLISLRALNLSNCMIGSLQSLIRHPLPAITAFNIRANRLDSIIGVEKLLSLERLDLRENRLEDPAELIRLTGLPDFHEVWVVQNPFTKSHNNNRTIIFNLFRNTPGPINDILIDASGPTSSERKQLIDRVTEGEPASVVRDIRSETYTHPPGSPSFPQDETSQHSQQSQNSQRAPVHLNSQLDHPASTLPTASFTGPMAFSHAATKSKRYRKGVRSSRIVDFVPERLHENKELLSSLSLCVGQESRALPAMYSAETDLFNQVPPAHRPGFLVRPSDDDGIGLSRIRRLSSTSLNMHEALPSGDLQNTNMKAQVYRRKVEALKQEAGSNWLSALTEGGWISDRKDDGRNAGVLPRSKVRPEVLLLHTSNQGVA